MLIKRDSTGGSSAYDGYAREPDQPRAQDVAWRAAGLVAATVTLALPLHAEDRFSLVEDAVVARAEEAWETESGGELYLRGGLSLRALEWSIGADRGHMTGKLEDPERITADGAPARIVVTREGQAEPFRGNSRRIEFEPRNDTVRLVGDAEVLKGRQAIRSQTIDYDLERDTFSAGAGGRVRVVTTPK